MEKRRPLGREIAPVCLAYVDFFVHQNFFLGGKVLLALDAVVVGADAGLDVPEFLVDEFRRDRLAEVVV